MPSTWKASLPRLFNQQRAESNTTPRTAVLGVGNPFRSDDAAGVLVARGLAQRACAADTDRVLIIEAGQSPENQTGEVRKFNPDLVIIVDAAEMGEAPGAIRWILEDEIDGMSASTHSMPLSILTHYLQLALDCDVWLLGIQVTSNEVGESVSSDVVQAVNEIVEELDRSICETISARPHYTRDW